MNTAKTFAPFTVAAALTGLLLAASQVMAAPPDLTAGGVPDDTRTINLGPTGVRGWVYHVRRQHRRKPADPGDGGGRGSPADGVLAANDVILGADGTGADPALHPMPARAWHWPSPTPRRGPRRP